MQRKYTQQNIYQIPFVKSLNCPFLLILSSIRKMNHCTVSWKPLYSTLCDVYIDISSTINELFIFHRCLSGLKQYWSLQKTVFSSLEAYLETVFSVRKRTKGSSQWSLVLRHYVSKQNKCKARIDKLINWFQSVKAPHIPFCRGVVKSNRRRLFKASLQKLSSPSRSTCFRVSLKEGQSASQQERASDCAQMKANKRYNEVYQVVLASIFKPLCTHLTLPELLKLKPLMIMHKISMSAPLLCKILFKHFEEAWSINI